MTMLSRMDMSLCGIAKQAGKFFWGMIAHPRITIETTRGVWGADRGRTATQFLSLLRSPAYPDLIETVRIGGKNVTLSTIVRTVRRDGSERIIVGGLLGDTRLKVGTGEVKFTTGQIHFHRSGGVEIGRIAEETAFNIGGGKTERFPRESTVYLREDGKLTKVFIPDHPERIYPSTGYAYDDNGIKTPDLIMDCL